MLFEHPNYHGRKWFFGLGSPGPIDKDWNDRVSSIRIEDATDLEVAKHSENGTQFNSPDNVKRMIFEDAPRLGDLEDEISYLNWWTQK